MFPAASPDAPPTAAPPTALQANIAAIGIVTTYAVLQILLTIWHEPWVDEAQAWLLAEQLSRPIDFLVIPSEGHPPLWYWLLRALSAFMDFSEARYVSPAIAIANAWLLSRLLRKEVPLLILMLGSFVLMQFWGYHFRPYGIVFMALVSALLLDRKGHGVAATWTLAIACGFHFFAGFLFAFWLVWQWSKATPVLKLLGPALLAGAFGVSAILSGLSNGAVRPMHDNILTGTLYNLGWSGMVQPLRSPWLALVTMASLVYGLRKRPLLLAALLALLVAFAAGTAGVYGTYPWHLAFMTMLCFTAFAVVGFDGDYRRWIMVMILVPQVAFGVLAVKARFSYPSWRSNLYQVVSTDAGADFRPERDLVAWPDLVGVSVAAIHNIQLINGNDGSLLGPIDWRRHDKRPIAPELATKHTPFWIMCADCEPLLEFLSANGRALTHVGAKYTVDNAHIDAYRVD